MVEISKLQLQDFKVFEAFAQIAEITGTEIILHGGAAFRAALYATYQGRLDFDLFDLVPFNSDIDLEHAGPREKSAEIARYIDMLVPFASWCRWSINNGEQAIRAQAQRDASTDIPLRRIRFSTAAAADVPDAARYDIKNRRVSFERNPRFGISAAELRPDLELFGLMVALNTWDEAEEIARAPIAFDEAATRDWIAEGFDEHAIQLLTRPGVVGRFWHLLSRRLARVRIDEFNSLLMQLGAPLLDNLNVSIDQLNDSDRAISVSKITRLGYFRVPELTPAVVTGELAAKLFGEIIRRAAQLAGYPAANLPTNPIDLIDPSFELSGIVPDLTLLPYRSGDDGGNDEEDPFFSGVEQEFVQFAWDIKHGTRLDPHALTGQLLTLGADDFGTATALPVVGGTFGQSRAWVRVRLDDLIERGRNGVATEAVLLILQARPREGEDAQFGPEGRRGTVPDEVKVDEGSRRERGYAVADIRQKVNA